MKKLSIIIRCWNRLEYTIRTIVSIDKHSGLDRRDYEIICVDQGSTDGTIEWLKSAMREKYYPIVPIFLENNVGDGKGMREGCGIAKGKFIAQHDNDIEIVSSDYFKELIKTYELLEQNFKVCSLGAVHVQGINENTAPWKFAKKIYPENRVICDNGAAFIVSWVTGSFIFRKSFLSHNFGSGMCNSWGSHWWDQGYANFLCSWVYFWHIDSSSEGGEYVGVQAQKLPSYKYVTRHYGKFI